MAQAATKDRTIRALSRRVVRRLVVVKWFRLLRSSALWVFVPAAAAAATLRFLGAPSADLSRALFLVFLWAAAAAVWACLKSPSPTRALALWDERARRDEMFVSAYCFELEPQSPGEKLHLARTRARLREEMGPLRRDLPAHLAPEAWLLPLAFVGFAASGAFRTRLPAEDAPLTPEARERVRKMGEKLSRTAELLDPLKGLSREERRELAKLKSSLEETARELRKLAPRSPREILDDLERRAREAERLAEELGCGADQLLSSDMIAELERHADTAELASALRAADFGKIAEEAEKLAERLRREGMSIEERERIKHALNMALRAAMSADVHSPFGRRLAEAHKLLKKKRRLLAARQFSEIARQCQRASERHRAERQLQSLAESLRSAGQQIFGRKTAGMRRLKKSAYAGLQNLGSLKTMPVGRWMTGKPPTGCGRGLMWGGMGQTPVPGTGSALGTGAGQIPVPGASACEGGLRAGHGSAPYGNTPTARLETSSTGVVDPLVSGEGPSMVRSIDGRAHREEAARKARALAIEFLASEEEALSAEPLPLSRREQVLRYFTTLRRRIEREH